MKSFYQSTKMHWQKAFVLLLVLVLPVTTVLATSINTKYAAVNTVQQQMELNTQKMHQTSRSEFDKLYNEYNDGAATRTTVQDSQEMHALFDLGYDVLGMLENGEELDSVFEYFVSNLSEERQTELQQILCSLSGLQVDSQEQQSEQPSMRGMHNIHLVYAMDIGYATGTLAVAIISVVTSYFLGGLASFLGPFGFLLGTVLGYIAGELISFLVNQIVLRWYGYIPGFRYVLFTIGAWWFWGSSDNDINIIDLVKLVIGGIGGYMGYGARPVGVSPPRFA
ncbi:MAG: hypothetical protein LBU60_00690 [Clostridiales bacterium]|jgi:hypothetical protein|nr:hypothetical protein [Clostridiales bacterium]